MASRVNPPVPLPCPCVISGQTLVKDFTLFRSRVTKAWAMAPTHDHQAALRGLCLCCLRKKAVRSLSQAQKLLVKDHLFPDYPEHEGNLPSSICNSCRCTLSSLSKSSPVSFRTLPDFAQMSSDLADEVGGWGCRCDLCRVFKWNPMGSPDSRSGPPRSIYLVQRQSAPSTAAPPTSLATAASPAASSALATASPPSHKTPQKSAVLRCTSCHSEVEHQGAEHTCNQNVRRRILLG